MRALRPLMLLLAAATPAVAFHLSGPSVWTATAAGLTVAAAIAAFLLWQDELLSDVLVPKRLDIAAGAIAALALYFVVFGLFLYVIAPAGVAGGLLRRCDLDGVRLARLDARGITAVFEWVREQTCRGYAKSLGIPPGPLRGLLLVFIAVLEELAWRGGVQQWMAERLGSTRGWLAASVLYGAAQLGTGNPLAALLAFACGLVWGGLYRYRGRLAPAMFSHAVFSYFLFYARPIVSFA